VEIAGLGCDFIAAYALGFDFPAATNGILLRELIG